LIAPRAEIGVGGGNWGFWGEAEEAVRISGIPWECALEGSVDTGSEAIAIKWISTVARVMKFHRCGKIA